MSVLCPVCDGDADPERARPFARRDCRWCQQIGLVSERQRAWLLDEKVPSHVPGRTEDDEVALLEQYREDFNLGEQSDHEELGSLADGLMQAVARIDDYEMTRLARAVGLLEAA